MIPNALLVATIFVTFYLFCTYHTLFVASILYILWTSIELNAEIDAFNIDIKICVRRHLVFTKQDMWIPAVTPMSIL